MTNILNEQQMAYNQSHGKNESVYKKVGLFKFCFIYCLFLFVFFFSGVDPKSVLCAFFKQGQCTKGDKCKFSHDLSLERKGEKKSVYVDCRDEDLEKGKSSVTLILSQLSVFTITH